jgi:hypothetical protein
MSRRRAVCSCGALLHYVTPDAACSTCGGPRCVICRQQSEAHTTGGTCLGTLVEWRAS